MKQGLIIIQNTWQFMSVKLNLQIIIHGAIYWKRQIVCKYKTCTESLLVLDWNCKPINTTS